MRSTWRTALVVTVLAAIGVAGTAGAAKLITGQQIKNGSIGLADLSKSARNALKGKAGAQGAPGPQGPAGTQGAAGPASIGTTIRRHVFVAPANDFADGEVRCPDGMVATGGSVSPGALVPIFDAPSDDGRGWVGSALEVSGSTGLSMLVTVVCTPGTATVLAIGNVRANSVQALEAQARAARP